MQHLSHADEVCPDFLFVYDMEEARMLYAKSDFLHGSSARVPQLLKNLDQLADFFDLASKASDNEITERSFQCTHSNEPALRLQVRCSVLSRSKDGLAKLLIGVVEDQHFRQQMAKEMRTRDEQFQVLISQVRGYAIFATDSTGNVTSWNEGCQRVLGFEREEFLGLNAATFFTPEDRAEGIPERELVIAENRGTANNDRWLMKKDGTRFWAMGLTSAVMDDEEQLIGFIKILRDQTEWKLLEERREHLLEAERTARSEAERINRLKDEFLAMLSHELRSPLNAIVGWAHLLARNPEDSERTAEGIQVIARNAEAQSKLISGLLDMSQILSGKVKLDWQEISLVELVEKGVQSAQPAAHAKGITIKASVPSRKMMLCADSARLHQVLWNLLSNAIKFTPPGGQVVVRLDKRGDVHILEVSDTGQGIKPEFLPHVFDRFRQQDSSFSRRHGGLGLGLSIARSIIELHGGTISVSSPGENKGATFRIELRDVGRELLCGAVPPSDETLHAHHLTTLSLKGVTVLVVDDERDARTLLKRILEEAHATVLLASSSKEGFASLMQQRPDIVVSDIGMPEEDGLQFMERVRRTGTLIPAIAVTAYARNVDRLRALRAGFQAHLTKPIEPVELLSTVAALALK